MRKKVLFIIAQQTFRDEELLETKAVIENAGIKTAVASLEKGMARGKLGAKVKVDLSIDDVKEEYYDAIVFVGGAGCKVYFDDERAWKLAREFHKKGKIVAAICSAPTIVANAGLLIGKRATAHASEVKNLVQRGAEYTGLDVEEDRGIITASGPRAAEEFGERIVWRLG